MSVLLTKETRVLVQGITGKEGSFHTKQMVEYDTNVVAGVTPGKGGQITEDKVPIFHSVKEAKTKTRANASIIFVPPAFAPDAILESIANGIDLIVCITEGIAVNDMVYVAECLKHSSSYLIGPNCPGVITPEVGKMGIMPGFIHKKGSIGVISRSGTLTYETVFQLTACGFGQSTCIGIGGDPIIGTSHLEAVKLFAEDDETEAIVMIGEIGGTSEEEAAEYIAKHVKKPVAGFIAGQTAPPGKRMGHAGAIVSGESGKAENKIEFLQKKGIAMALSPADIGSTVAKALS